MARLIDHTKLGSPVADALASQNAAIDAALRDNFRRTVAMFERVREMFRQQRAARAAYRELSELSDRELADLGISRSDIRDVARGKFPGRV
ncbi:DUF1127 domain-containing protein [Acidiphilium sp.]|uniref:DUF1127 domain-containing protein n=1 Tax=Acidiphilium sp. TaxID=527 RepID=UPI003D041ECC